MRTAAPFLAVALLVPLTRAQVPAAPSAVKAPGRQAAAPTGLSAASLWDFGNGGVLKASSAPELGRLYPLSNELFVAPTGEVGVGTTSPSAQLHVSGTLMTGGTHGQAALGSAIIGGEFSSIRGIHSAIVGGRNHLVDKDATESFLGGGIGNEIQVTSGTDGYANSIVGGIANHIFNAGRSVIAGGNGNEIGQEFAFSATLLRAFIGGGVGNRVWGDKGAVVGGDGNRVDGSDSGILAGANNWMSGDRSVALGGQLNQASGNDSVVAGTNALASHDASFVFADDQGAAFATTAPQQFLIRATGGVGIGTSTPSGALEAAGSIRSSGPGASFTCFNPNNAGSTVSFGWLNDVARIRIGGSGPGANGGFDIQRVGNQSVLRILDNGRVGILNSSPSERLDVNGNVRCTALIQTSDARLKRDVRELEHAMDTVRDLHGVSFEWDPERMPDAGSERQVGFLAQELREVLPEVVHEDDEGTLAVSYSQVVPVLVEALKEQDRRIAELEARDRELTALLEEMAELRRSISEK
jgi:hypothetical protein